MVTTTATVSSLGKLGENLVVMGFMASLVPMLMSKARLHMVRRSLTAAVFPEEFKAVPYSGSCRPMFIATQLIVAQPCKWPVVPQEMNEQRNTQWILPQRRRNLSHWWENGGTL